MKASSLLTALFAAQISTFAQAAPTSRALPAGIELRILPLGDSITWGYESADGNGYRLSLLDDLTGEDVVFAGVVQNGNMADNWMAGYPGWTITMIAGVANASLVQRPNVVLIHAGQYLAPLHLLRSHSEVDDYELDFHK